METIVILTKRLKMKRLFNDNGELGLDTNLHIDANNQIKELFERFTESGYCYKDFKLMLLMLADNCEVEFEYQNNKIKIQKCLQKTLQNVILSQSYLGLENINT